MEIIFKKTPNIWSQYTNEEENNENINFICTTAWENYYYTKQLWKNLQEIAIHDKTNAGEVCHTKKTLLTNN